MPWSSNRAMFEIFGWGHWVIAVRNVYVGAFGWADSVGLPGSARSGQVERYYRGEEALPVGVDYVFYGPMERIISPRYDPRGLEVVYRDEIVTIYKAPANRGTTEAHDADSPPR